MVDFGTYCLLAGLVFSGYSFFSSLWGGYRQDAALVRSSENSLLASFVVTVGASVALWFLFLTDQFQVEYVFGYSSLAQPLRYKLTAFWGGQSGSLLFWVLILSIFSSIVVLQNRNRYREMMPWITSVLSGTSLFFLILLNFSTSPFELLASVPPDGQGLNPLLQNAYMTIHPPALYVGYIGLTVPFAFAIGALVSGRLDTSWIAPTRKWGMISWCFLTFGIALGGMWAYEELGWGGYWAWDPVENASFMPWLVATAFLHSIMITEKKGMLKMWNFILILLAFELSIFGTFITRSGVVSSVHSFAQSSLGYWFVAFLGGSTFAGLFWIFYRSDRLKSQLRMRSFLSREATFLLNNWLFVSICFAVFWGTVFPLLSEWATGEKISVTAPFFNKVTTPLWLALLVLTGICPLIAWRKASLKNFRRNFVYPLLGGLGFGILSFALGARGFYPLVFLSGGGFVLLTVFFEFYKGARARQAIRPSSLFGAMIDLTAMNKRRYGGFVIHLGAILVFVGITASSAFSLEQVFTVPRGGSEFSIGGYTLKFENLQERVDPEKSVVMAPLEVFQDGRPLGRLVPEKHFHRKSEQPQTEVVIRSSFIEDLYVVLSGWDEQNVTFHVFVNPMVLWIWIGVAVMVLGGVFVLIPDRKKAAAINKKRQEEIRDQAA